MIVAYEFVHVQISPMLFLRRCFDNTVLLKQSAYRNRTVLGRYCDVSSYNIGYTKTRKFVSKIPHVLHSKPPARQYEERNFLDINGISSPLDFPIIFGTLSLL